MYLASAAQMQTMDQQTIDSFGIPGRVLMESAGRGATDYFCQQFEPLAQRRVTVVAGRGNNGGDGFVMARYLSDRGIAVSVVLLTEPGRLQGDALANFELLAPLDIPVIVLPDEQAWQAHKPALARTQIWIDAILGTGLKSDVRGHYRLVIETLNASNKPIFAVDIPSGLHADTGQPCGVSIRAQATATFGLAKTGHFLYPGRDLCGKLQVIDIGIPHLIRRQVDPRQQALLAQDARKLLQPRAADAHKGHNGHLLVVAGSTGKTGAAAMTATSALRVGGGLVTLALPASLNMIAEAQVLEAMTYPLADDATGRLKAAAFDQIKGLGADKRALALGPGLGTTSDTVELVKKIVQWSPLPMVIDADGLNCIATDPQIMAKSRGTLILTPHPGEMARLTGLSTAQVQADRIGCARDLAHRSGALVVLKGAATVIALPDGHVFINTSGNAGMASGGMGDVLTGVIGGLLSQGYPPRAAACLGTYLHGAAADLLNASVGPYGYLAGELMPMLPRAIAQLTTIDPIKN
jgi:NAD(P)H-hydrate epimerase